MIGLCDIEILKYNKGCWLKLEASSTLNKKKRLNMKKVITKKTSTSKVKKAKAIKELVSKDYIKVLREIKKQIQEAQVRAAFSVNRELLKLYWEIGKTITEQQKTKGWGTKTVENLAQDIQKEFPGIEGFSERNVFRMRAFFSAYELVTQAVSVFDLSVFSIPWGHNIVIFQKLKNAEERLWYAQQAIENGWSRSVLEMWIESHLFKRQGKAVTNFKKTFPKPDSDMAEQTLKDPYNFDF